MIIAQEISLLQPEHVIIIMISVIIKLQEWVVFRNIFTLNMKVSSILVINVINNLQGKVISKNIFSLNTKILSILVIIVNIKLHNLNFMWKRFQITKQSEGTFESHSQRI